MTGLSDALFATAEMRDLFSSSRQVALMLEFEVALAGALADVGRIPPAAADAIAGAAAGAEFDVAAIREETAAAGTPVVPLVAVLRAAAGDAGAYVHFGATSQDVIDTAAMLQARDGLRLLENDLAAAGSALDAWCAEYAGTPTLGRTLLQPAQPITFGVKAAQWLAAVTDEVHRLRRITGECIALQFGGAVGTLASLGGDGPAVADRLGERLGLAVPPLPWHTRRGRVAELASAVAIAAAAASSIAGDLLLLNQPEVGEVRIDPGPGRGGSSAMPHKRNPVGAVAAVTSARLANAAAGAILDSAATQEHERAAGSWQVEWTALPAVFLHASGAVAGLGATLAAATVDPDRMRANLEAAGDVILSEALAAALTPHLGGTEAWECVARLVGRVPPGGSLLAVAAADEQVAAVLDRAALETVLDPAMQRGSSEVFIAAARRGFAAL